jgi:protein-disulfide isomerase/uncharacterized membrane protein
MAKKGKSKVTATSNTEKAAAAEAAPATSGAPSPTPAPTPSTDRPWALKLNAVLMLVAAAISVYMTRHHETQLYGGAEYQGESLVGCAEAAGVSCDVVNTSAWSELLGVPLFTWGLGFYVAAAVLSWLAVDRYRDLRPLLVAMGLGAVAYSGFLYRISVDELKHVCLWCMRLYGLNAALLGLAVASGIDRVRRPDAAAWRAAASAFAVSMLIAVGGQKAYRATLLGGSGAEGLVAASDLPEISLARDPKGDAPTVSMAITTEDGRQATLTTQPDDAWKGSAKAKVTVVEFADFECGYCKRTSFELRRLYDAYKDDVAFVFKHFPMDPGCNPGVANRKHGAACEAAGASVCAKKQGRFWAMHDLLFKNNHALKAESLIAYAKLAGVEEQGFLSCMRDKAWMSEVQADGEAGKALDIHGTPRIFINGTLYRAGTSAEQLAAALEAALGRTGAEASANAAKLRNDPSEAAATALPTDLPTMQRVDGPGGKPFWIDTFEAGLVEGKATSGVHEIPGFRMSWHAADAACKAAGKRMCTEAEWISACQNAPAVDDDGDRAYADDRIEGTAYPYGDFHEPERCWEGHENPLAGTVPTGQPPTWRPSYTGQNPACVSKAGVYDLAGNVEEWVGATANEAVLLGGAFDTPDDKARCYRRNDTFGSGYANLRTGFRCCKDNAP